MTKRQVLRIATILVIPHLATAQCEIQKLTASSSETIGFGESVALSEEFAVLGTPYEDTFGFNAGAAYVFQSTPTGWVELAQLFGEDPSPDADDLFGESVAISGNTILISASGDEGTGAVFVFDYDGVTWNQTAKLSATSSGLLLGSSVAIDGDRALLGVVGENNRTGAAYIFERSGSVWSETARLAAPGGVPDDEFGRSVALSGELALVGAPGRQVDSGAAFVFDYGSSWALEDRLTPSDPETGKRFGFAVDIDGQTALIGASGDDTLGESAGAAYVFQQQMSTWSQEIKLIAADGGQGEVFGRALAIEDQTIVVGSAGDHPGSTYVFSEGQIGWKHVAKLVAGDGVPGNGFGSGVGVAGEVVLVGAQTASGPFGNLGAAYVFQLPSFATAYCFGLSCPCGNDDPVLGGCANSVPGHDSTPQGALLAACGSASTAEDDLVLTLSHLPPNKFGLFFMGGGQTQLPFGDGFRCVDTGGLGLFRYNPPLNSGNSGLMTLGPGIVARSQSFAMNGHIDPGETWYFQGWYRDPMGPCGTAFNLSNGLAVTFEP